MIYLVLFNNCDLQGVIMIKYISKSENDTINIAKEFAKTLSNTDIVVLTRRFGVRQNKIYSRDFRFFWT